MGTRLRPLTYQIPKPLVPLLGKPLVEHIMDALPGEVDTVILAVSYMREALESYFEGRDAGRKVVLVNEGEPLGTGGAVRNVREHLDGTFLVFNGDVISSLDVEGMLRAHRAHGGIATISLWQVDDPSAYGAVGLDDGMRVTAFQEKPAPGQEISNRINAGAYVFEPSILDCIPEGASSLERDVFPKILDKGMHGHPYQGYWVDCGTRESLLRAQRTLLAQGGGATSPQALLERSSVKGDISIGRSEVRDCIIGPNVFVGDSVRIGPPNGTVGERARVRGSMVLDGAVVEEGAQVSECIIGPGAVVRRGENIEKMILVSSPHPPA